MIAWNQAGSKWVEPLLIRLGCLAICVPAAARSTARRSEGGRELMIHAVSLGFGFNS